MRFAYNALINNLDLVGITEIIEDTNPTLGGDLNTNGFSIISDAGENIPIQPGLGGSIILDGFTWPTTDGASGDVLTTDGSKVLSFQPAGGGSGDVVGPASAVDDNIATFDGITGKLIQDGGSKITDLLSKAGNLSGLANTATSRSNLGLGTIAVENTPLGATVGGTAQTTYATGDMLYASAANTLSKQAIGAINQVQVVSGGIPTWGDNWYRRVSLSKQTASNSSLIAFTSFVNAAYTSYFIRITNMLPVTDNTILQMFFSTDNGATYLAANYKWTQGFNTTVPNAGANGSSSASQFQIQNAIDNAVPSNFLITLFNINHASIPPFYLSEGVIIDNGGTNLSALRGGGGFSTANQVNAIKFQMSSGNISSGTFTLYGVIEA